MGEDEICRDGQSEWARMRFVAILGHRVGFYFMVHMHMQAYIVWVFQAFQESVYGAVTVQICNGV